MQSVGMKTWLLALTLACLVGCATDDGTEETNSPRPTAGGLPPDTGLTGVGGTGTGGGGQSGAGISGIGVDRQRTTGTGTMTNQVERRQE